MKSQTARRGPAVLLLAVVALGWGGGPPPPSISATGALDYEPVPPGQIVESVTENSVTLTFDPAGGPFTGLATLRLAHDVPERGCRFTSARTWELSGEFQPATLQFVGEYREVGEATDGACENFTFTRTFDPDEGRLVADLDPVAGTITSPVDPVDFVLPVDPALVASLVPAPPVVQQTALDTILAEIAARHSPVTAVGLAAEPTGAAQVGDNTFTVAFNPVGGDSAVSGVQEVEATVTLDDGRVCTVVTVAAVNGTGRYDPITRAIVGTSTTSFTRDVPDCDVSIDPSPDRSGTIDLAVDAEAGVVSGSVGEFGVTATFAPAALPPPPGAPFRIDSLSFDIDGVRLRIAIEWEEPWPPPPVGALLVGGRIEGDDGPISFGVRYDDGVSTTFMEPDGDYSAFIDDRGRTILDVDVDAGGDAIVGGPIIRMHTWTATPADAPGSLVATFDDTVDPAGAPIEGEPVERVQLPFGLPALWAGDASAAPPDGASAGDTVPAQAETSDDASAGGTGAPAEVVPEPGDGAIPEAGAPPGTVTPLGDERGERGGGGGGGIPPALLLIPGGVLAGGAGYVLARRRSRGVAGPAATGEPETGDPCAELARRWRAAQDECDRASRHADELAERFDELDRSRRTLEAELGSLPSEERRVELPDGSSLSELDLDLRRRAAAGAWRAYLDDPTADTARAAEEAWSRQATPEWLQEQRRAHRERRQRLEREAGEAAADRERTGSDLAEARRTQRETCGEAAAARRDLDECLQQARQAPPEAGVRDVEVSRRPEPAGAPGEQPAATPPPAVPPAGEPAPSPPGTVPAGGPCPDGAERWVEFDGPHPFLLAVDDVVEISIALVAGTDRSNRLGSLDGSGLATLDERGRAASFPVRSFIGLTPGEVESAFGGEGGLAGRWKTFGSGAGQRIAIELSMRVRRASAVCERQERCVEGEWVPTGAHRSRVTGEVETVTERATVVGNTPDGLARDESEYLAEIVALFQRMQLHARQVVAYEEPYRRYVADCRAGRH